MENPVHLLVSRHSVATDEAVKQILDSYSITVDKLPVIFLDDPALNEMQVRPGDVIIIERLSPVTKQVQPYYRVVVE